MASWLPTYLKSLQFPVVLAHLLWLCWRSYGLVPLLLLAARDANAIQAFPAAHFWGATGGAEQPLAKPHDSDIRKRLRFYIYPLPAAFHRHILESFHPAASWNECPPTRWPCTMNSISQVIGPHGQAATIFWQYLAEVVILQKFLALGALLVTPSEADVFVVPALLSAGSFVSQMVTGRARYRENKGLFSFDDLVSRLPHYNAKTAHRHLFLRTSDCHWSEHVDHPPPEDVACDWFTADFRPGRSMFVTLGMRNSTRRSHVGHIVVPPLIIEHEFQPSSWLADQVEVVREYLLFLQCSPGISEERLRLVRSIEPFVADTRVQLVKMDSRKRIPALSQREAALKMRSSTFCPIPVGDLPFTTRYFYAILSGCIPVMVRYPGGSWFEADGPLIEDVYPWPGRLNHRAMVVEIPEESVDSLVTILRGIPHKEVLRKRQLIFQQRAFLGYDFAGSTPDSFSMLLDEIETRVGGAFSRAKDALSFESAPGKAEVSQAPICLQDQYFGKSTREMLRESCHSSSLSPRLDPVGMCTLNIDGQDVGSCMDALLPLVNVEEFSIYFGGLRISLRQVIARGRGGAMPGQLQRRGSGRRILLTARELALARGLGAALRKPAESGALTSFERWIPHRTVSGLVRPLTIALLGTGIGLLAIVALLTPLLGHTEFVTSRVLVLGMGETPGLSLLRHNLLECLDVARVDVHAALERLRLINLNDTDPRAETQLANERVDLVFLPDQGLDTLKAYAATAMRLLFDGGLLILGARHRQIFRDDREDLHAHRSVAPEAAALFASIGFGLLSIEDPHAVGLLSATTFYGSSWRDWSLLMLKPLVNSTRLPS